MDADVDEDMTDENIQCEGCKKDLTAPSSDPGGIKNIIKKYLLTSQALKCEMGLFEKF